MPGGIQAQRGRAVLLFRTTPATIYIIASTGAMLDIGQERSRVKTALAAELGCIGDSKLGKSDLGR